MTDSPTAHSVSLVIPMFNEEENIEQTIDYGIAALRQHASDWEIVIVDDASTDRSAEIVHRASETEPRIRLLSNEVNRKLGATLRKGLAAARMDLVLYMDADIASDPDDLGRAIRILDLTRADVVAAYRFDRTTEGIRRWIFSSCYNALIGLLFGWPYRDINFAFKLFRRPVLQALELRSEGSLIDAEMIIKAKNLGFVVQQMGVDYFPRTRGTSNLASFGVIGTILRELITLQGDMRHPRRRNADEVQR